MVMGGGGARAAHQVGLLRALARRYPHLEVPILTGVSAGAINAAFLASHPGTFQEGVEDLARLWSRLTLAQVIRVDGRSLFWNVFRWGLKLISGGRIGESNLRSLVDTAPLQRFLYSHLPNENGRLVGIQRNLEAGRLRAVALSTSSYSTGRSITWVEGVPHIKPWERPQREARLTHLTVDHVMASSALPLFFPAVRLGDEWYGDGGIRLTAPLSPALHLGASQLLAISTRHRKTIQQGQEKDIPGYPPPAQVAGSMLNAIFLDLLDSDAHRLEALNELLAPLGGEARGGFRPVELLTLRPSRDLGRLAGEHEEALPPAFRFLTRGLGTKETRSPDILSFLLFDPAYLKQIMALGEVDGEAQMSSFEALLQKTPQGSGTPATG